MAEDRERWHLVLDVPNGVPPASAVMRRLLKYIGRSWGIRCTGYTVDAMVRELEAENARLRERIRRMGGSYARDPQEPS